IFNIFNDVDFALCVGGFHWLSLQTLRRLHYILRTGVVQIKRRGRAGNRLIIGGNYCFSSAV
ncbi:hypothetical protein, partial [Serratia sp. CY74308]|uniref:hypothetical protein n=1 Tax=Serratia sp. CY74308 TaxID=3383675 RepID=UPI003FA02BF3